VIKFWFGPNEFQISRAAQTAVDEFLRSHSADAVQKIMSDETDADEITAAIVNISLLAPERLIIVDKIDQNKAFWENLPEIIARVPDSTELILTAKTPDKRTKTYKHLLKNAAVEAQEFVLPREYEMPGFVRDEAKRLGLKIAPDAIDELIQRTSGDGEQQAARIATELAKLQSLHRDVTRADIAKFVEPNAAANVFMILEMALTDEKSCAAAEIANLRATESADKFIGLLASQVFALSAAVAHADTKTLKIHPFQLQKMGDLARRAGLTRADLAQTTRGLAELDAAVKLAKPDEAWTRIELWLEQL
jgi:DNA polymerase III delta subunit